VGSSLTLSQKLFTPAEVSGAVGKNFIMNTQQKNNKLLSIFGWRAVKKFSLFGVTVLQVTSGYNDQEFRAVTPWAWLARILRRPDIGYPKVASRVLEYRDLIEGSVEMPGGHLLVILGGEVDHPRHVLYDPKKKRTIKEYAEAVMVRPGIYYLREWTLGRPASTPCLYRVPDGARMELYDHVTPQDVRSAEEFSGFHIIQWRGQSVVVDFKSMERTPMFTEMILLSPGVYRMKCFIPISWTDPIDYTFLFDAKEFHFLPNWSVRSVVPVEAGGKRFFVLSIREDTRELGWKRVVDISTMETSKLIEFAGWRRLDDIHLELDSGVGTVARLNLRTLRCGPWQQAL